MVVEQEAHAEVTEPRVPIPINGRGEVRIRPRRLRSPIFRAVNRALLARFVRVIDDPSATEVLKRVAGQERSTAAIHRHDSTWNARLGVLRVLGLAGKPSRPMRTFGGDNFGDLSTNEPDPLWVDGLKLEWKKFRRLYNPSRLKEALEQRVFPGLEPPIS